MIKYASEVVIFILVRIDSPERARNLDLTLSHLYGTGIRIEVWEIDAEQKYQLKLSSERIFIILFLIVILYFIVLCIGIHCLKK